MAGTGTFGQFKLGPGGDEVLLPELNEYHRDRVVQGGTHVLLSGKAVSDEFGQRYHFYLGWKSLTEEEASAIDELFYGDSPMSLVTHEGTYKVVRANHAPWDYNEMGYIDTNIELEEAV